MIACHTENLSAQILQLNLTFKYLFHQGMIIRVLKLTSLANSRTSALHTLCMHTDKMTLIDTHVTQKL